MIEQRTYHYPMASGQPAAVTRLAASVRDFWLHKEAKFKEVWRVLDTEPKEKFASACLQACTSMYPDQPELLFPEITVEAISTDEEHIYRLFWYYYTDDGMERDVDMMQDLVDTGQIEMPVEQACAIRQMGILQCLNRVSDVYESIWSKGVKEAAAAQSKTASDELKATISEAKASVELNQCIQCKKSGVSACAKCKKVKYCGRDCQAAHWPKHKPVCGLLAAPPSDAPVLSAEEQKAKDLADKLAAAKAKIAAKKENKFGPRVVGNR